MSGVRLSKKLRWMCAALPILLAFVFSFCVRAEEDTHVVILATSDMHANVWGYTYEDDRETDNSGMARLYTYIRQVREENPIVFLVDAGDEIQGTILSDDIANKHPEEEHPVMAAMNKMGYDAMTLGNHEFNWGIKTLKTIIRQAKFPVLAANVLDSEGKCLTGKGWTIIEHGGVRLAVIGVCTPDVPIWDGEKEGIGDTVFEAGYKAVGKALEEIGDQADLVLVSAHMGEQAEYDKEGADSGQKIIQANPGVDLLQVGHLHITVNDSIGDVPVVGVRNAAREIARIDLWLTPDRQIKEVKTQIVEMDDYAPSEEIRSLPAVKRAHEQALRLLHGGDGEGGKPGMSLGSTTERFQPENEIRGLPEGMLRDTAVIDLILNVELENSGADVAAGSLFKRSSDLPEGDIYYNNIFDIYKYDNTLYTLDVTGRELKDYMEWSARCYNQWEPGDINISFDPAYPCYRYDMFEGVSYEINLSKPDGERIENVQFHGKPLEDDQVLKLAVNNFRYSSAIKGQHLAEGSHDWESSCSVRDMLVDYFEEHSPVEPMVDQNWHITGVDLSLEDPRRAEIIGYINEGLLPVPYEESYNLADYDRLVAEAEANQEQHATLKEHEDH